MFQKQYTSIVSSKIEQSFLGRNNKSYHNHISEIILRQIQVKRFLKNYQQFIKRYSSKSPLQRAG
jgi:adenine-specific DNA glycosylase